MELEDLITAWKRQGHALEKSLQLNTEMLSRMNLTQAERKVSIALRGIVIQLIFDAAALLLIGSFAGDHAGDIRYLVPAALLGIFAIALIADAAGQIAEIRSVDYDEPVIAIQGRLLRLRSRRLRRAMWTFAVAPLMWAPLAIVAARGIFGVDVYSAFGWPYVAANAALGVLVLALSAVLVTRAAAWAQRHPRIGTFLDDVSGRSLANALESLDALQRFVSLPNM